MEHIRSSLAPRGALILDNVSMNSIIRQPSTMEMIEYMFAAEEYFYGVPVKKSMAQLLQLFAISGVGTQDDYTAVTVFNKQ